MYSGSQADQRSTANGLHPVLVRQLGGDLVAAFDALENTRRSSKEEQRGLASLLVQNESFCSCMIEHLCGIALEADPMPELLYPAVLSLIVWSCSERQREQKVEI